MSKNNEVPVQFTDGPDSHTHLLRALQFLGTSVPKKITIAWQAARAAAWAWKRGTCLDLIGAVVMARNHLNETLRYDADVPGRDKAIEGAQSRLDDRQALLDAVPEEAERWKMIEARRMRKQSFENAQVVLLRLRGEQKPVAIEDVRYVAELRQQVVADEQALRQEGKVRKALHDDAERALDDLRFLIVDTLTDRLNAITKAGADAIGKDAAIYFEYRELLQKDAPKFQRALMEAKVIQEIGRDLGAEFDLVAAFSQHFPAKDKTARDLIEAVILGEKIQMGSRRQDSADLLTMEV